MKYIFAALLGLSMVGCGSIINGSTEQLSVSATPTTATISLYTSEDILMRKSYGHLQYKLKKSDGFFSGRDFFVRVEADGYSSQTIGITSSASGWYVAGNLLFGGLIGWFIVDPASGGMWVMEASNDQDVDSLNVVLLSANEVPEDAIKLN